MKLKDFMQLHAKDFSYEIISSKASQEFALNSLKYKSHLYPMSFNSKINSATAIMGVLPGGKK